MAVLLLMISLCVATVIQLTSSQSTYEEEKDNSCGRIEQMINKLETAISRLESYVENQQKGVIGRAYAYCLKSD